jgi:hypothetical protein
MKMGPRRRQGKPKGWVFPEAKRLPGSCSAVTMPRQKQGSNARPDGFTDQAKPMSEGSCSTSVKYPQKSNSNRY